jgi:hypothetical protein
MLSAEPACEWLYNLQYLYFRLSGSDESLAVGQLETLLSSRTFTHLLFQLFDADQVSFFISSVNKVKCFFFSIYL